jgi:2-polyprenyl-3-methyl-5-hydroxy-6-metoxy-1,4-benzoquinol methylase
VTYFRLRRAIELISLDRPWVGELLMRRRFAKPQLTPPDGWDAEYSQGVYDRLLRSDQQHHHRLLASLITEGRADPAILEIGCGEGAFWQALRGRRDVSYRGIDFSKVAIERAHKHFAADAQRCAFEIGDGRTYSDGQTYDAVVFPEVIEYLGDIPALLDHYAAALKPGGLIGVTMWMGVRPLRIWRQMKAHCRIVDQAVVHAAWGGAWLVATLQPRPR